MEWMLRDDARPGTAINELELARQFGVATTGIREFLNRFQRFGLIEKRPNAGWVFKGFTDELRARAVRDPRDVRAALGAGLRRACPESSPLWRQLEALRDEHLRAARRDRRRAIHDFSDLDSRFHRLINSAAPNRFIDGFYDIITLIFHYHYQWNKQRRAAAQRGRDPRAPRLHRRADSPGPPQDRTRLPGASRLGENDAAADQRRELYIGRLELPTETLRPGDGAAHRGSPVEERPLLAAAPGCSDHMLVRQPHHERRAWCWASASIATVWATLSPWPKMDRCIGRQGGRPLLARGWTLADR